MRAMLAGVLVAGCIDLSLPVPPGPPRPGSLSGRIVTALPARSERAPVKDAEIVVLGTSLVTTSDSMGAFLLEGITSPTGRVLVRVDLDRDGSFERQKLLSLEALRAGVGKAISLGDVLVGDNARIEGKVLLGDVGSSRGHGGSLAFVPEGPFTALSADDGTFILAEVPEGTVTISLFRAGYRSRDVGEVQVSAGQALMLKETSLVPLTSAERTQRVRLSGRVVLLPAGDPSSGTVELADGSGLRLTSAVTAAGEFSFVDVSQGLYTLTFRVAGYRTAIVSNVVVEGSDRDLGSVVLTGGTGAVGGPGGGAVTAGGDASGGASGGGAAGGSGGGVAGGGTAGGIAGGAAGGSSGGTAAGSAGGSAGGTAGGSGGGAGTDGGSPSPRAVVDGRTTVRVGALARLDGTRSVDPADAGALSYRWIERSDAGVILSANDSVLAGSPTFAAPSIPRSLAFELIVTSQNGTPSQPASTIVEVLESPIARVSPTSLVMRTGSSSTLTAAGSTDPSGAPLTFVWSVVAGGVTLSSTSGPAVTVNAPLLAQAAQVSVVVSNAAVSADPVIVPIVVSTTAVPVATVDVGPAQVVGVGASVTITATATSTNASERFSFNWAQTSGSAVALAGVTSPLLGFTAPSSPGRLTFTVTATGDAGATGMAVATVDVEDDVPPTLVSSDPPDAPGASGGWYSLTATFSEPLDPVSVSAANVELRNSGMMAVPVSLRLEGGARTIRVTPQIPLVPGDRYSLVLGGLTDATPRRNSFAGRTMAFNARPPRFTKWTRTAGHTSPSILAVPSLAVSSTQVWIVARESNGTSAVPYGIEPDFADGGVRQRVLIPGANFQPALARRGFVVNDVPHVLYPGSSATITRTGPSTWANLSSGSEVVIATDGNRLVGVTESYGPHWITFSSPSTQWLDEHVDDYRGSMPPWVGLNSNNAASAFAVAVAGPDQLMAIPTTVRSLRVYLKRGGGSWQTLTNLVPLPSQAREVRAAFNGTRPLLCYVHVPTSGRQLSCSAWESTSWNHATDLGPGTVEALDVISAGQISWLTYAAGGQLRVKWLRVGPTGISDYVLNGPTGVASWNSNMACTAQNPESFATPDALYVAWEEGCGGNQDITLHRVE